jgi:hypothetical protein
MLAAPVWAVATAMSFRPLGGPTGPGGPLPPNAAELNAKAFIEEALAETARPDDATELRGVADDDRRAARIILDREAQLCAELPEAERAHPTFLSPDRIEVVERLVEERRLMTTTVAELRGAQLVIRAGATIGVREIARLLRCHIAWRDAVGPHAPNALADPFMVGAPDVSLAESSAGVVIRIRGRDKAEGQNILQRAQRLAELSMTP